MTDIVKIAQAWLEHCREEAEYFHNEGEDDTADKWREDADEAEAAIKHHIDSTAREVALQQAVDAYEAAGDSGSDREQDFAVDDVVSAACTWAANARRLA